MARIVVYTATVHASATIASGHEPFLDRSWTAYAPTKGELLNVLTELVDRVVVEINETIKPFSENDPNFNKDVHWYGSFVVPRLLNDIPVTDADDSPSEWGWGGALSSVDELRDDLSSGLSRDCSRMVQELNDVRKSKGLELLVNPWADMWSRDVMFTPDGTVDRILDEAEADGTLDAWRRSDNHSKAVHELVRRRRVAESERERKAEAKAELKAAAPASSFWSRLFNR